MKQILKINDDEKLRILEMHKSSTKRHYLNENTSSVPSPPSGLISDVKSEFDKIVNPIKDSIPWAVKKLYSIDSIFDEVYNLIVGTIPEVYKGMYESKSSEVYSDKLYKKIFDIFEKRINGLSPLTVSTAKAAIPDNWKRHFNGGKTKTTILGIVNNLLFLVYNVAKNNKHLPTTLTNIATKEEKLQNQKAGINAYAASKSSLWKQGLYRWYQNNKNSIVPSVIDKIDKKLNS